jgi:alkylhydroperoxidase family enzyme
MFTRITPADPATTDEPARKALDDFEARFGSPSPFVLALAASLGALEGYTELTKALARGSFRARDRERIALLVADRNGAHTARPAHEALAARVGLEDAEIEASRRASAAEPKADALLKLAAAVVDRRGAVTDEELTRARAAGLSDGEIVEVVANVALNVFPNYLALVAGSHVEQPSSRRVRAA